MRKRSLVLVAVAVILITSTVSYSLGKNQFIADKANFKILLDGSEFETVKPRWVCGIDVKGES